MEIHKTQMDLAIRLVLLSGKQFKTPAEFMHAVVEKENSIAEAISEMSTTSETPMEHGDLLAIYSAYATSDYLEVLKSTFSKHPAISKDPAASDIINFLTGTGE